MRTLTLVLTIGLLVLGVTALARGEDEGTRIADLQKQVERLELQVSYLMAREVDTTLYVLANHERAETLKKMVAQMEREGYTSRAIPAECRETHLRGLLALANSMQDSVPVVSEKQAALLKSIARAK